MNPCRHLLTLVPAAAFVILCSACVLNRTSSIPEGIPAAKSALFVPRRATVSPLVANGQKTPVPNRTLGLAECIGIALHNNPDTARAWHHSRSAAAGVGRARSAYLPSADLTVDANRAKTAISASSPESSYNAGFSVRYLLFDGGARLAGLQGTEAELLDAGFKHNAVLQDLALGVEEAYYQLLAAKEVTQVAEQTIRQVQYHVDVAYARHQNGLVTKSDLLKTETELADAKLQLVRAASQVRIARGQLASAMGLSPSSAITVTDRSLDPVGGELADIKELMTQAINQRPELRAALARVADKQAKKAAAESRYWPKVSVNTAYGHQDQSLLPEREQWSVGVGLALPLFEGFDRDYAVRQAQADLEESTAEYDQLLQGVELESWTAYSQLIEAGQAIKAAHSLVTSAEESAKVAEAEYKNGTSSIIDLTDAQTARTTAKLREIEARFDWYTAMARLERAVGKMMVEGEDNL